MTQRILSDSATTSYQRTQALLEDCTLCPRQCHVNRLAGNIGFCGQTAQITAARASLHMWEEPCISGSRGSGTVFFSGCNLQCVYCQNHDIALTHQHDTSTQGSHFCASAQNGKHVSEAHLAEIFLQLQEQGANNINLVTPSHFVPQICTALLLAKAQGLSLPIVYNTGSYEHVDTLKMLEGLVDVYLPDLKYYSPKLSKQYSHAEDYFDKATAAIAEMIRQTGSARFYSDDISNVSDAVCNNLGTYRPESGIMMRGTIVRHLLLPGQVGDSKKILRYLHNTYGNLIYISIMSQYTPLPHISHITELNRQVTEAEYQRLLNFALQIGIENGFFQEGDVAMESFIPDFNGMGIYNSTRIIKYP